SSSVLQFHCVCGTVFLFLCNLSDADVTAQTTDSRMGRTKSFKDEFTFEQRVEESHDIMAKYPDRIPVIVEKYSRTDLPQMEKKKYLVPRDMSVGQFIYVLSSRLHLAHGKALFVFVKDTLPLTASLMDSVYESFKDKDGFLYMCYSTEKTFGGYANVQRYEQ
ncbi:Ubiquitin-like superfamily protein, partial [Prunus dulcis]